LGPAEKGTVRVRVGSSLKNVMPKSNGGEGVTNFAETPIGGET